MLLGWIPISCKSSEISHILSICQRGIPRFCYSLEGGPRVPQSLKGGGAPRFRKIIIIKKAQMVAYRTHVEGLKICVCMAGWVESCTQVLPICGWGAFADLWCWGRLCWWKLKILEVWFLNSPQIYIYIFFIYIYFSKERIIDLSSCVVKTKPNQNKQKYGHTVG